jgi:hypothetical protein
MATTTPNYGWTVPTSTDLVKDGATAIETLGDAIDASMNTALGTKKAGMVLLNTTSFSAVASQSINDVFSATYDNYKIVVDYVNSTSSGFRMRLRVGGADNSTASSYTVQQVLGVSPTTVSSNAVVDSFFALPNGNTTKCVTEITLIDPFLAENTTLTCYGGRSDRVTINSGFHNQSVSYTGITLLAETGTVSGTAYIYGMAK